MSMGELSYAIIATAHYATHATSTYSHVNSVKLKWEISFLTFAHYTFKGSK